MPDKSVSEEKERANNEVGEIFRTLYKISEILNTGLDAKSLGLCVRLCENGVHPEALAKVIKEIKQEINQINGQKDEINN